MTAIDIEGILRQLISVEKGTIRRTDSPFGPVISVEPKKPNSARMTFNVSQDESEVAGTIGIDVPVEVSATQSRYCSLAGLDEFAAIVSAVVIEGFVEKVWRQWSWVTKSRATRSSLRAAPLRSGIQRFGVFRSTHL